MRERRGAFPIVIAPISLVGADLLDGGSGRRLHAIDGGLQHVPVIQIALEDLAGKNNCSRLMEASASLQPNLYRLRALPFVMQTTTGACNQ